MATASVTYQFAGFTAALPLDEDGLSTIGFAPRPDLDRVLAATNFLFDTTTGELLESDIFFNTAFSWSVAQSGEAGRYDLESIALHEEGHFSGLGHSALGETEVFAGSGRRVIGAEAVMFPIAFSAGKYWAERFAWTTLPGFRTSTPRAASTRAPEAYRAP